MDATSNPTYILDFFCGWDNLRSTTLIFDKSSFRNGVRMSGYLDRVTRELVISYIAQRRRCWYTMTHHALIGALTARAQGLTDSDMELAIQKAYRLTRNRYGIGHHSDYLLMEYWADYGANDPSLSDEQRAAAFGRATAAFTNAIVHLNHHEKYRDSFDAMELALLDWTEAIVARPHEAHRFEPALREAFDELNREEVAAGIRRLDRHPKLDDDRAFQRLLDHQISELAMVTGHYDGLGRALCILKTEFEPAAQIAVGELTPHGIRPELDENGCLQLTGRWTNRQATLATYLAMQSPVVLTVNELPPNPELNKKVKAQLAAGEQEIRVTAEEAAKTGEF